MNLGSARKAMNATDPEKFVRDHYYPHAEAQHQMDPSDPPGWTIYPASGRGEPILGHGATEAEAWADAARKLGHP